MTEQSAVASTGEIYTLLLTCNLTPLPSAFPPPPPTLPYLPHPPAIQKPKQKDWHPPDGFILGLWTLILLVFFKTYGIKHLKHIFWASCVYTAGCKAADPWYLREGAVCDRLIFLEMKPNCLEWHLLLVWKLSDSWCLFFFSFTLKWPQLIDVNICALC